MNITLHHVSKRFFSIRGSTEALRNIDLHIKDGEFFILLGPSGCGKSTLLNTIAGLEKLSGGSIRFGEGLIASSREKIHLSPKERNVAMVFQNYALYPHMTVYDNIAFPLLIAREAKDRINSRVRDTAQLLRIESTLHAMPKELSGGQRQRVAIARAIVRHPEVFLLDEPLSNLDAKLRVSTRSELKKLQKELGVTTIYVTHDQLEAMALGDRIAVMRKGKIEQVGTPDELYHKPASTFVAGFVGTPPMNLLPAEVVTGNEHESVRLGSVLFDLTRLRHIQRPLGTDCTLGIRPEDIHVSDKEHAHLALPIASIEPLGREVQLNVSFGDHLLSLYTRQDTFDPGDIVPLRFDEEKIYLFNEAL